MTTNHCKRNDCGAKCPITNKSELALIGKGNEDKIEPHILIEDPEKDKSPADECNTTLLRVGGVDNFVTV